MTFDPLVKTAEFAEILPIWREFLWPARKSSIESVSAIAENGKIDLLWRQAEPCFWKLTSHDGKNESPESIGVVSGLFLTGQSARLRGLWIHPQFRSLGLGKILVDHVAAETRDRKLPQLWTMARESAAAFYLSCAFQNPRSVVGYEYGPHVLLEKPIFL